MKYQNDKEFSELVNRVKALKPLTYILEIGSMEGETLLPWLQAVGRGGIVVSVDMMVPHSDPRRVAQQLGHEVGWPECARALGVTLFVMDRDSTRPETVTLVKALVPFLDFLFIDGGHDFNTCCQDYQNYGSLVRSGGLIAFHDMGREWPDVRRVWESIKEPGVREEICVEASRWGIGILHKP